MEAWRCVLALRGANVGAGLLSANYSQEFSIRRSSRKPL
jgi:hypothetical protein